MATESPRDYANRLRAASPDGLLDMLRVATEQEARTAVVTLGLRELYALPRDIVESWEADANIPGTARYIRAHRLTTERWVAEGVQDGLWRRPDIARAANVSTDSVGRWRNNLLKGVDDWKKCLPSHTDGIGDVKNPGERPGERGGNGIPMWEPSVALDWLKRSRKVTADLYCHDRKRGGGIPTGRPPRQRTHE